MAGKKGFSPIFSKTPMAKFGKIIHKKNDNIITRIGVIDNDKKILNLFFLINRCLYL